jgi:hypothetical protein
MPHLTAVQKSVKLFIVQIAPCNEKTSPRRTPLARKVYKKNNFASVMQAKSLQNFQCTYKCTYKHDFFSALWPSAQQDNSVPRQSGRVVSTFLTMKSLRQF